MTVWFVSDTHFCHKKIAETRGFSSPEEHDRAIVANWTARIRHDDIVWLLGDVSMGNFTDTEHWINQLSGKIHLVTGNHDAVWPGHRGSRTSQKRYLWLFESVQAFAKQRLSGTTFLLSHFPYQGGGDHTEIERYTQFRLPDMGEWLLHGHVHSKEKWTASKSLHIGLDAWGLCPVSERQVIEEVNNRGTDG